MAPCFKLPALLLSPVVASLEKAADAWEARRGLEAMAQGQAFHGHLTEATGEGGSSAVGVAHTRTPFISLVRCDARTLEGRMEGESIGVHAHVFKRTFRFALALAPL